VIAVTFQRDWHQHEKRPAGARFLSQFSPLLSPFARAQLPVIAITA